MSRSSRCDGGVCLNRKRRFLVREVARASFLIAIALVFGCSESPADRERSSPHLRVGVATEPQTWNPLVVRDLVSNQICRQLHGSLVRINLLTQTVEPMLAESWVVDDDGRTLNMSLRSEARFSDGEPFTAADVVFTFDLLRRGEISSQYTSNLQIDGAFIEVEAVDDYELRFHLPSPVAAVERLFADIGILPRHLLQGRAGGFDDSLSLATPVSEVVGLGPFRLDSHVPGQRTTLVPNPFFWGTKEAPARPRLAGVVFDVVPDAQTRLLRLKAGELDLVERLSPDTFAAMEEEGLEKTLRDVGPGMTSERLWFNLKPDAPIADGKKRWFSQVVFRRAVSNAIDRRGLARVVYQGYATAANGTVSPANHFWADSAAPRIQALDEARAQLRAAGFSWDDRGSLRDEAGEAVRFRLLTSQTPLRRRAAAFIQEDLARVGIHVDLVMVDGAALMSRILGDFDYDACLLGIAQLDPDPSAELPIWMSSGQLHVWNPSQSQPASDWERELDRLMTLQMKALDVTTRRRLYSDVQALVRRELPLIDLVYPHELIGNDPRVVGLSPTPFGSVLWNLEEVWLEKTPPAANMSR